MPRPIRDPYVIPYGAAFGAQRAGGKRRHNGTDYHAPPGTPVYATGRGVVRHVGYSGDAQLGLGHNIMIDYDDGSTLDGHLQSSPTAAHGIRAGSRVTETTRIGSVGRTGNAVNADPKGPWNGNHLHHERRNLKGLLVNPEVYYGAAPDYASGTPIVPLGGGFLMALSDKEQELLAARVAELWEQNTTGREGVKHIGAVARMTASADAHSGIAATEAKRAADLIESLVVDFRQGQEGSHHAGRLYLMLTNASAGTTAPVDINALATALASKLDVQAVDPEQIKAALREVLGEVTLTTK